MRGPAAVRSAAPWPDVLIFGDTLRSPEMRHEVPVAVPDPFLYVERDGTTHVLVSSFEVAAGQGRDGFEVSAPEEFGSTSCRAGAAARGGRARLVLARPSRASGSRRRRAADLPARAGRPPARERHRAHAPTASVFAERRRVKNEAELAGIRRAQRARRGRHGRRARAAFARAEAERRPSSLDGEPLTCERVKTAVERGVHRERRCRRRVHRLARRADRGRARHGLGPDPRRTSRSCLDLFPRDRESGCFADMTRASSSASRPRSCAGYHRSAARRSSARSPRSSPASPDSELFESRARSSRRPATRRCSPSSRARSRGRLLPLARPRRRPRGARGAVLGRAPGELVAGDVIARRARPLPPRLRRLPPRGSRARHPGRRRGPDGLPVRPRAVSQPR